MLQYNLRALFGITLAVALATWVAFVLPGEVGATIMLMACVVATSALVAGTVYFGGYARAFSIGCLVAQSIVIIGLLNGRLGLSFRPGNGEEFKIILMLCVFMVLAGGAAAVGVRHWSLRTSPSP